MSARSCPCSKTKLGVRLLASIVAALVIPSVIISSVLIACGVTAIIVIHVFAFIVGSAINAVVIVGSHVFIGVCIIKQRFRVRFLSRWRFSERSSCRERACAPAS